MKNSKITFKPALLAGIITFSTLPAMHLSEFTFPPQWFAASFNEPSAQNSNIIRRLSDCIKNDSHPRIPERVAVEHYQAKAKREAYYYIDQIEKTPLKLPKNKSDLYALISPIIKTLDNNDALIARIIKTRIEERLRDAHYTQQENDEFLLKWANLEFLLELAQKPKPKL